MILTGLGCAEQRHHAIAQYTRHRAAELADRFHHRFERRLEALQRLLRVSLVDQRRRTDDVGKEDRQPFALRFPRRGSRVVMRRRFVGAQRNAATAAEFGDRGVAEATGHAHGRQRLAACLAGASMVRVLCSTQPTFHGGSLPAKHRRGGEATTCSCKCDCSHSYLRSIAAIKHSREPSQQPGSLPRPSGPLIALRWT